MARPRIDDILQSKSTIKAVYKFMSTTAQSPSNKRKEPNEIEASGNRPTTETLMREKAARGTEVIMDIENDASVKETSANAMVNEGHVMAEKTTEDTPMGEEAKAVENTAAKAKKAAGMKEEEAKKAVEMDVEEAMEVVEMNTDDKPTTKKETTVKMMAQKMANLKRRRGEKADADILPERNKDSNSDNGENLLADGVFAQRLKQASAGQRQKK